jgi:hypothetical protein
VTPNQIAMAATDDITFILGRLEGKVDSLLTIYRQQSVEISEHDSRLRKLEAYKAYLIGITVAVATIASLITHSLGT